MEAPKKIYLFEDPITETPDYRWSSKRSCNDDVEYVPFDVFIKKACDRLRKGGSGWYLTFEFGEDEINFVKLAEDFKTYMKGE